jgi:hypothetical protein
VKLTAKSDGTQLMEWKLKPKEDQKASKKANSFDSDIEADEMAGKKEPPAIEKELEAKRPYRYWRLQERKVAFDLKVISNEIAEQRRKLKEQQKDLRKRKAKLEKKAFQIEGRKQTAQYRENILRMIEEAERNPENYYLIAQPEEDDLKALLDTKLGGYLPAPGMCL